ncbi:MAG: ribosome-associated translation inhibitor RaiA [Caldilineaceae bacterium]|uniref:Ribosome hibernation promoting factor n=1 Tax=Caldilineaceae bacterium SB0664_bin_27 TaxID=2605260 RepID=A0A6B0YQE0_9CHLR|nr:ribosome-associated translation inhibitor RaiA [Caldilineaceae bacterium]MDE0340316.1 ribosome-associated translation inhibitor RaiA [Caldilineaceae bacterium]MXY92837.1 ribosome-associated translation inhibitor RaiA [Caldilineaceae bacterium SB0664_bin_27]
MNLTVHGRNVAISDRVQDYVDRKVGRLDKYLPRIREARVELVRRETRASADRYTAQLTIWASGQILRAEESSEDLFASIDAIADKMFRQIERFKGRRFKSKRRDAAAAAAAVEASATQLPDDSLKIVRTKQFVAEPMLPEEAAEQMELLGHDFFVFYNVDSRSLNIVYGRRDGNYGLLQPRTN